MPKHVKSTETQEVAQTENIENEQMEQDEDVKIINFDTLDMTRLFLKPNALKKEDTQYLCYPKYLHTGDPKGNKEEILKKSESPIIVTDEIEINKGGIPRFNPKYHTSPDASTRAYFYIAKDENCQGAVQLFEALKKIDDYCDKKINKEQNKSGFVSYIVKDKNTGKEDARPFKGLTYKRMITETKRPTDMIDDEDDDKKKEFVPYERVKVKFSTKWDENLGPNDAKEIDTVLFIPGKDEQVEATKITDFDKYFTWKSTCKFGLMLNKLWIKKDDKRECSFGIKCIQLAVTKERPDMKKNAVTQLSKNLFTGKKLSTKPEESKVDNQKVDNQKVDKSKKPVKKTEPVVEAEADEEEQEEEEEQEQEAEEKSEEEAEAEEEEAEEEAEQSEEAEAEEEEEEEVEEAEEEEEEEEEPKKPEPKGKAKPAPKAAAKQSAPAVKGKGKAPVNKKR